MEVNTAENENVPKKRGRKKQLYKNILSQMEFYFSASNLAKDRWLSHKLEEENAIPLTEFLKFNKIRALTQDVNDLAKALRNSELIAVTEDMKVIRTQPIKFKENEDDYIIYIEQIPSDADHEWLSSLFSRFGKIDYISIPKFKHSNKCKGFAFIEYANIESAERAVQEYKKSGNYLSTNIEPAELMSISTYEEPKDEETAVGESSVCEVPDALPTVSEAETTEKDNKLLKRKKKSDSSDETPVEKKPKTEESIEEKVESSEERNLEKDETVVSELEKDETVVSESEKADSNVNTVELDEGNTDEAKKKKNRRKKSKKKKNGDDTEHPDLQVLSKKDWKRLRNKYLNMQKEKMKQLKKHIFLAKRKAESSKQNGAFKKNDKPEQNEIEEEKGNTEKTKGITFSPGLIVKVKFDEPAIEVKELKSGLRKNQRAEFVDVKEGDTVMHIRFASAAAASEFCEKSIWPTSKVLRGEKEEAYWTKIQEQRKDKLSKNVKKKERGKDKLMRKAENILGKHITFD